MSNEPIRDPLALGLGSLGAGTGFGAACLTGAQIVAAILRGELEPAAYHDVGGNPLLAGLIAAIGVGGAVGWYRSVSLESVWQRGVIASLAAVGACLVGFLGALVDRFFGPAGLAVWFLLNVAFAIVATRWAIQGKGPVAP